MKELKRVVVTGLGAITPIGNTTQEYWAGLLEGKSGADFITQMDASNFKTRFGCEVKNFVAENYLDRKETRSMDLYSQYAVASAVQAMDDAKLTGKIKDPFRAGVIFASGIGGLFSLQEEIIAYSKNETRPRFSPHMITKMIANIAAGIIAIRFDMRGMNYATVSACASSSHAIIDAFNYIRLGKADIILTGGSEASINATSLGGFSCMKALSERNDDPKTASRPFDANRDGFVLGEGAGALVLESLEHARERGATIYAEISGGGMTADAYHFTLPHPEGRSVFQAMKDALDEAELLPSDIDYINLHGTSTPMGDPPELMAVHRLFDECADKLHVSATKSMTGHLLGAAGAIEAAATVLAVKNDIIPPTINTQTIDPNIEMRVNPTLYTPVKKTVRAALSNTFGFGGQNASMVFKKHVQ